MARDRLLELTKGLHVENINNASSTNSFDIQIQSEYSSIDEILNEYGEIRLHLATISGNLEQMTKMIQTTNLRTFEENEMDKLRNQNLKIGFQLMKIFKDLQEKLPNENDFTLEARMKRTLFYGLHQKYINIWGANEMFLQSYENKLKKNLQLHSKIMNYNSTEEEVEELLANKKTSLFVDNILEETERERQTLRDLMQRFSELKKIEKSIEDVHTLFLRIQNLVAEQNERIQIVEYHAQQATVRVDKGADELDSANKLKKKAMKKMTILVIILIVVFILFILFAFFV